MKKEISHEERRKIWQFYMDFRANTVLNQLYKNCQHRTSNTYHHACLLARRSIEHALKKNLDIDYYSLIRGVFLHDLFFNDWKANKGKKIHRLSKHLNEAYENAYEYFDINDIEKDIIVNHMWPITLFHHPKTKEGKIVMRADKRVTLAELFAHKKDIIIFDLDGTLLDTLDDLANAVNYSLQLHKFPTRDREFVRLAIGNGVAVLIRRCLPEGVDEDTYNLVLKDFREYYLKHVMDNTKPYPGNVEALKKLRRKGFYLAVATNKLHSAAYDLIQHFFPHLFDYVQGDDGYVRKKPSYDMIASISHHMGIRKRDCIIYVGDTTVDYQTAKNAHIKCVLVDYGFRSREETLPHIDKKTPYVSSLQELVDYLDKDKAKPI